MLTLKAEKRNPEEKAKKLRRDGFITGVLYGKEMKENVSLKFTEKDAAAFIKNAKEDRTDCGTPQCSWESVAETIY